MVPRAKGPGAPSSMSNRTFIWLCLLPLAAVTAAFFLLPMARLVVTGAEGPQGAAGYLAILLEPRYRATLINTVLLAAATTVVTLVVATIAGMFLQRHRFPGRAVLIAMLTFPLAFPGVVVGVPSDRRVVVVTANQAARDRKLAAGALVGVAARLAVTTT